MHDLIDDDEDLIHLTRATLDKVASHSGPSDPEKLELFDWLSEHWQEAVCDVLTHSMSSTRAIDQLSDCAHRIRFNDMPDESFMSVLRRLMNAEVSQRQSYVDAWCSAYVLPAETTSA